VIFRHVLDLAQHYVPLREDQRFYWQKTLAQQRQLFLLLGQCLTEQRALGQGQDIFFLTKHEVEAYVQGAADANHCHALAESRQRQFARLCQDYEAAPGWAYPSFLQGSQQLKTEGPRPQDQLRGHAVSPGLARGRVVVLFTPAEFGKIQPGDVLVTRTVDPGWTPIFGRLGALVTEHGGQLSHGAVVAREYGLPAVAGIPGITQMLRDGDTVIVDGLQGIVARSEKP
jgi:pyruvate,water dikinase